MCKFILGLVLLLASVYSMSSDTDTVDAIECSKYAIQISDTRNSITGLQNNATLYMYTSKVHAAKIAILKSKHRLYSGMGDTSKVLGIGLASIDVIRENKEALELYNSTMESLQTLIINQSLVLEKYENLCGDYIPKSEDLHTACSYYPELTSSISCTMLKRLKRLKYEDGV